MTGNRSPPSCFEATGVVWVACVADNFAVRAGREALETDDRESLLFDQQALSAEITDMNASKYPPRDIRFRRKYVDIKHLPIPPVRS